MDTLEKIMMSDNWIDNRFANVSALIIKVTHRCNLDCTYCYENITGGQDMHISTFKELIKKAITSTSEKRIHCIFHGGEPTLLSNGWYEEALNYANGLAVLADKKIKFSIQSNFINIKDEQFAFYKYYRIGLSMSIDGPPSILGSMRRRSEKVIENYVRARALKLPVGILMTINHSNFKHFAEIMPWIDSELKVQSVKINTVSNVGAGYSLPSLQPENIFEAHKSIIDYLIKTKGEKVIEENIKNEIFKYFSSHTDEENQKTLCRTRICGAGKRVLGITTEGNLLPCGRFAWDNSDYFIGNISDSGIDDSLLEFNDKVSKFHSLVPQTWYDCDSCTAKKICSFGCQAFIVRSKDNANVDCLPTKMKFKYFNQNENELYPLYIKFLQDVSQKPNNTYSDYSDSKYNDSKYNDYDDTSYSDSKTYDDYKGYDDYTDSSYADVSPS